MSYSKLKPKKGRKEKPLDPSVEFTAYKEKLSNKHTPAVIGFDLLRQITRAFSTYLLLWCLSLVFLAQAFKVPLSDGLVWGSLMLTLVIWGGVRHSTKKKS